jgi:predicted secreted protein
MPASTGFTGRGAYLNVGDGGSPEVFAQMANVTTIGVTGRTAEEIDFTHLLSEGGYREFRQGFKDAGTMNLTVHWNPSEASHISVEDLLASGEVIGFEVVVPAASAKLVGQGYIQGSEINITVGDPVTNEVTIRVTGPLDIQPA